MKLMPEYIISALNSFDFPRIITSAVFPRKSELFTRAEMETP